MGRLRDFGRCLGSLCTVLIPAAALAAPSPSPRPTDTHGVVEIETTGPYDLSVSLTQDLASVIDDGATRRVLSVLGKGSAQNVTDLAGLHGIDMAVVQTDVLNDARRRGAGLLTYITKLYNEEFYLLVRADAGSFADLANHAVDVDVQSSGTRVTTEALFGLYHVPVQITMDPVEAGIARLKRGEIAAVAIVAPKPLLALAMLKRADGLRLLSLPEGGNAPGAYPTTTLTAQDYPDLIAPNQPVNTVLVGTALVAADLRPQSERYQNIARFVDAFFTQYQTLLEPGHLELWKDIDVTADIPGLHRFPPAEQWLRRNAATAGNASSDELRTTFSRFIDQRQHVLGGPAMNSLQKDELFQKFEQWQSGQGR